jgi:sulfatase maturation enzyme AslB (radical SAM superfamily)
MILSINPSYYCNFRCDFCYLTEQQLSDRTLLPLDMLEQRIIETKNYYTIDMIDLYGGEIGLLSEEYVNSLCNLLNKHDIDDINIITNLSMVNDVILNPDLYVTVSYDFDCREQSDRVWNNMLKLTKPFSILILASKDIITKDVDDMIVQLSLLTNLRSVEIKPYSINQANSYNVSHTDYETFVQKWIDSPITKEFQFINEDNINESLNGTKNAFSNDHIYITPKGQFAVLEFDLNDREYFKTLNNIDEYIQWANNETKLNVSQICRECEYYGRCLTEHYRYVKTLDNGCNGYKNLLDWYKNARMEN